MSKRPDGGPAGARLGANAIFEGLRRPQADNRLKIAGGDGVNEN